MVLDSTHQKTKDGFLLGFKPGTPPSRLLKQPLCKPSLRRSCSDRLGLWRTCRLGA